LAERQTHQVLFDAIEAALSAGDSIVSSLSSPARNGPDDAAPTEVMEQLREGLRTSGSAPADAEDVLRLVEAIRVLAVRHGPPAVQHCTRLVESLRRLLDTVGVN
jgi:hypothetical protein